MPSLTRADTPALSRGAGDVEARRTTMWLVLVVGALVALAGAGLRLESSGPAGGQLTATALQDSTFVSAAQLANSRRLGGSESRFWAVRTAAGVVAANPLQRLRSSFGSHGITVAAPGATVGFSLTALGRGGRMTAVSSSSPTTHANQVSYGHTGLTEWYANGPIGLEQGLRLAARPSPYGGGPLTFSYRLSGSGRPALNGGQLTFFSADGAPAILYDGLSATDARGRTLPAWLQLRGSTLRIGVNDAGAAYPITVDPLIRFAKLADFNRDLFSGNAADLVLPASTALSMSIEALTATGAAYTPADDGVGKTVVAKVTLANPVGGKQVTAVTPAAITAIPTANLVASGSPTPAVPAGGYSISPGSSESFSVPFKIVAPSANTASFTDTATYNNDLAQPNTAYGSLSGVPIGDEQITIQTKAWIPFPYLVDPERLIKLPYDADLELHDCYKPISYYDETFTSVSSFYRGDTHIPYDGSYRVQSSVSFSWDGTSISNFTASGDYGTTHRDLVYNTTHGLVTCLGQEGTATSSTFGTQTGNTFKLGYNSSNPLIIPAFAAPGIDSGVSGYVNPDGEVVLFYAEDEFPSHGIQVSLGGTPATTDTVGDASCLGQDNVLGVTGATILAWGLTHQDNTGSIDVNPAANPTVTSAPSPICSQTFWGAVIQTVGAPNPGTASDVATAHSASVGVQVAPVTNGTAGAAVPLATAVTDGLVAETPTNVGLLITSAAAKPVQITATGASGITTEEIVDGKPKTATLYAASGGKLVLSAGSTATVTHNGKKLAGTKAPSKPPVTTATVTLKGKKAIVTFHVGNAKLISETVATIGRRKLKITRGKVTIAVSQLAKLVFFSVDKFGNSERAHGLTKKQISGH